MPEWAYKLFNYRNLTFNHLTIAVLYMYMYNMFNDTYILQNNKLIINFLLLVHA